MLKMHSVSVSLLALVAVMVIVPEAASAADIADTGCTLHGAVMGGGLLGSQSLDIDGAPEGTFDDTDWSALFAEGAALATCTEWNFQADFAYYGHSSELNQGIVDGFDGKDIDAANYHFGGALFWRDSQFAGGLSGSFISQDTGFLSKNNDYYRVGLFGEFYANDRFTIGGSAHYFDGGTDGSEDFGGKDHSGFELAAFAKFYATSDLAFSIRGDYMNSDISVDVDPMDGLEDVSSDGFAVTGEIEYLVWDEGLSLFGGARYASREIGGTVVDDAAIFTDTQAYAGVKFSFGGGSGSLTESDRSGAYDNTSVMLEKLPNYLTSTLTGISTVTTPP